MLCNGGARDRSGDSELEREDIDLNLRMHSMRGKRTVLLLAAVVCLLPQTARARIVPSIDISKLTEGASLIVVGEVTSVQ